MASHTDANPAAAASASATRIDRQAAGRAVDSLLRWLGAQAKQRKAQLLEHDEPLRLLISLKRIPGRGRTNPYLIPLPHPLYPFSGPDAAAVCLIADDRPSAPAPPSAAEERIRAEGIPVSEVITLSDLRADYKPYEARRKLCGSYDLFLADRRILPLLPRLLGKQFFKKKKQPLPVDLSRKGWPEQLRRCLTSASLYLRTGTCCQLDVGRASQEREKIVDNVIAAIEGAVAYIPKKWANVRSIHLKSDESVALPIYRALPEMGFKIDTFRKKTIEDAAGEEADGEVVQSQKREEEQKKEKEELGAEKGRPKKGRIHEVRYMDTNPDDEDFRSDIDSDDGDGRGEEEHELSEEKKRDAKKRKKDEKFLKTGVEGSGDGEEANGQKKDANKRKKAAKVMKSGAQGSDEAVEVDGAEKRKSKDRKSDDKGVKTKTN